MISRLVAWLHAHPGKAGALAGWYQQFASGIVTLALIPVVESRLGAEQAGLWFSFQSLAAVVALTDFGFGFVLARQVAWSLSASGKKAVGDFLETRPGWEGVSQVYAACRNAFTMMVAVGAGLLILVHEVLLPLGKLGAHRNLMTTSAFYLLGASVLVAVKGKQFNSILEGAGRLHIARFIAGTSAFASNLAALAVLLIWGNIAAMAAAVLLMTFGLMLLQKHQAENVAGGRLDFHAPASPGMGRKLWRVAAPMGLVNVASWLINSAQAPLIGSLLGADRVGPFYAAQRIGLMLSAAVSQLQTPQMPLFTQSLARGDHQAALDRMRRVLLIVSVAGITANVAFFLLSPAFAHFWRGGRPYMDSIPLAVMALDFTLLTIVSTAGSFVLAAGHNPFWKWTILMGILSLICSVILGTWIGIVGVVMGSLVAGLLTNHWKMPREFIKLARKLRESAPTA